MSHRRFPSRVSHGDARRRSLVGLAISAMLIVAACGGDDAGSPADETSPPGDEADAPPPPEEDDEDEVEATVPDPGDAPDSSDDFEAVRAGYGDICTENSSRGSITMGTFTQATSLDPTISRGTGVTGGTELMAVYDTLMRWNPETGDYEPRIARSVEPNDDFTTWTLTLRDDVYFGNGDQLTSAAVIGSIERHQDTGATSRWGSLSRNIAAMEAPDDLTVVFELADPWATFPYLMAHEVGMIVNPAVVDELGEDFGSLPVGGGAGAFEPVNFTPGEGIVMRGKDEYWGGPVCVDELNFRHIAGAPATYDAFRAGEFNMAFLRDARRIDEAKNDGVEYFETLQNAGGVLMMNSAEGRATDDVRIRRAIAHAIDSELINDRIHEGKGIATNAFFGEDSRLHSIGGIPYDTDAARELLEDAMADGHDGRLLMLGTSDPTGTETAITIMGMLEAVGFEVQLENSFNVTQLIGEAIAGSFDILGWGLNVDDSSPWMKVDSHLDSNSPGNYWGVADPDFDEAIIGLKRAADDELVDAVRSFQEAWNEFLPGAVYAVAQETIIWSEDVQGVVPTLGANVILAHTYVG